MKTTAEMLEHLYPGASQVKKIIPNPKQLTLLKSKIASVTGLNLKQIGYASQKRELVQYRQLVVISLKIFTSYTLDQIASEVQKDHSTVLHNIKSAIPIYDTEYSFRRILSQVLHLSSCILNVEENNIQDHSYRILSKEFWRYAVKIHQQEMIDEDITRLQHILNDRDREIRLLRGQVERLKLTNSFQYTF